MTDKRTFRIIIGSKAYFDKELPTFGYYDNPQTFLDVVKLADIARERKEAFCDQADVLIVRNNDYLGIVEAASDRLGPLIEELTTDNASVFIHNPPRVLLEYLEEKYRRSLIEFEIKKEEYRIEREQNSFVEKIDKLQSHILGQNDAIESICKSLWYLTSVNREKPYVIMLYGNSGLGKTELVREIAKLFFNNKFLEKHLSMFKNNHYSDYLFGEAPNRRSLGFDLLERESNLIFLDEIDKCPDHFFSAFYTLFDNVVFKDATYDADISGTVIVLTSNYLSEEEIKKQLGIPIFCRIDKFIKFHDFSSETIFRLVNKEISERGDEYSNRITPELLYAAVCPNILVQGENARTIKFKVQQVIEELLFREVEKIQINDSVRI